MAKTIFQRTLNTMRSFSMLLLGLQMMEKRHKFCIYNKFDWKISIMFHWVLKA